MGLDWNPGNKPKPGFEAEHEAIVRRIIDKDYVDEESSSGGLFGFLTRSKPDSKATKEALLGRFGEISSSAFETLDAPRIGFDEAATQWAQKYYEENQVDEPEEEWLESVKGLYIVWLVGDCDGVPPYTNGAPGGYVEPFSFRAQFLRDCTHIIGEELLEASYETKTNAQTLAFGKALLRKAEDYARQQGLNPESLDAEDPDSEELKLDVVLCAGRWCVFWAEKGHFLEAYW